MAACETVAQRKEREAREQEEVQVVVRTIVKFKCHDEGNGYGNTYTASYDSDNGVVTITAPCGEETPFKLTVLRKLVEALSA